MTHPNSANGADRDGVNLRLVWPQWQGGGTSSVREFASEFPFDGARRGYAAVRQSSKRCYRRTTAPASCFRRPCRQTGSPCTVRAD